MYSCTGCILHSSRTFRLDYRINYSLQIVQFIDPGTSDKLTFGIVFGINGCVSLTHAFLAHAT